MHAKKYIIVGFDYGPAHELFSELFHDSDVTFIRHPIKNPNSLKAKVLRRLLQKHLIPNPFLTSVFPEMLSFDRGDKLVFIFSNPWIELMMESGFLNILRAHYPEAFYAAYLLDIHAARMLDIQAIKNAYDVVAAFDKKEACSLGVHYLPPFCSKKTYPSISNHEKFDLSFTGQAKDRYQELIKVYKSLTKVGLKCHFYIIGVPESEQYHAEGLNYGDDLLSPEESFAYLSSSRCVLEIQPHQSTALTLRVQEAVINNKKILTNNRAISKYKYYRPSMIQIYTDASDIDPNFFRDASGTYSYEGDYSPRAFIEAMFNLCETTS